MSFFDSVNSSFDKGFAPYKKAKDNIDNKLKKIEEKSKNKNEKQIEDSITK